MKRSRNVKKKKTKLFLGQRDVKTETIFLYIFLNKFCYAVKCNKTETIFLYIFLNKFCYAVKCNKIFDAKCDNFSNA